MKDGLRQKLNDWLKSEQGRVILIDVIENQVRTWGYKISNYERQLRPSLSPSVDRIMKNGAIVGYRWKMGLAAPGEYCCFWFSKYRDTHSKDCSTLVTPPVEQAQRQLII